MLVGWAAVTGTIGWQTNQLYAGVRRGESVKPLRLFLQSNNLLAVVFCGPAVDSVLGLSTVGHYL